MITNAHIKALSQLSVAERNQYHAAEIRAFKLIGRLNYLGRQHQPIAPVARSLSNCNLSLPAIPAFVHAATCRHSGNSFERFEILSATIMERLYMPSL
jgi:hypothetical protein